MTTKAAKKVSLPAWRSKHERSRRSTGSVRPLWIYMDHLPENKGSLQLPVRASGSLRQYNREGDQAGPRKVHRCHRVPSPRGARTALGTEWNPGGFSRWHTILGPEPGHAPPVREVGKQTVLRREPCAAMRTKKSGFIARE